MADWQQIATDLHTELFVALEGVDKIVNHGAPAGPVVERMQKALRVYDDAKVADESRLRTWRDKAHDSVDVVSTVEESS